MWAYVQKLLKKHHRSNLKRKALTQSPSTREVKPKEEEDSVKRRRVQQQSTRWSNELPFDVLQRILHEIGNDKQGKENLKSAAQVCRYWYRVSQTIPYLDTASSKHRPDYCRRNKSLVRKKGKSKVTNQVSRRSVLAKQTGMTSESSNTPPSNVM